MQHVIVRVVKVSGDEAYITQSALGFSSIEYAHVFKPLSDELDEIEHALKRAMSTGKIISSYQIIPVAIVPLAPATPRSVQALIQELLAFPLKAREGPAVILDQHRSIISNLEVELADILENGSSDTDDLIPVDSAIMFHIGRPV
jgi:hypothetical protein